MHLKCISNTMYFNQYCMMLYDSLNSNSCTESKFVGLRRRIGENLSLAFAQIFKFEAIAKKSRRKMEDMRSLIIYKIRFLGACNFFNIPHIHADDASKVNWKQHQIDVKRCQEDISEIDSSFNKTDWINHRYIFWRPAQMSRFVCYDMEKWCSLHFDRCIKYLINLKMSFIFVSSEFLYSLSQHFKTTHYLKVERSFLHPSLTSGLTRLFVLYICFSGLNIDHVDGAKGGFKCSSPTSQSACLLPNYSKFELPNPTGINPISVEILIEEVLRINDKDYSITFSCYYNINWPDKRIHLKDEFGMEQMKGMPPNTNKTMNPNIIVPMNLEMTKDLWLPNVMIYNLKTYKVMDVLSKLAGLWIRADYVVSYSEATHITFICPMHFDKFPLDTQTCKFLVGSYSYDDSQMTFVTANAKYNNKESNSIALDYEIEINRLSEKDSLLIFEGLGNFSLAGFELVLRRYVSTYIITYYLPSGLFVIVSWISFLIPMDVIPGRMALLVTLFLVLVNIFNNVTTNTPKAEGLTAIEAWMLACILFVFGALIE